MHICNCWAY